MRPAPCQSLGPHGTRRWVVTLDLLHCNVILAIGVLAYSFGEVGLDLSDHDDEGRKSDRDSKRA